MTKPAPDQPALAAEPVETFEPDQPPASEAALRPGDQPEAPTPPPTEPMAWPGESRSYRHNHEHLWAHLTRIDQLVRAQTVRWLLTIGETKPEHLWGMIHVTEAEIQAYLHSTFTDPDTLPTDLVAALQPYWAAAERWADVVAERTRQTPGEISLRLRDLEELYGLTESERDVLLVCLLPEVDERYRRLFGYLQDDASRVRPTVELVLNILYRVGQEPATARAAFAPEGRLLANHLLASGPELQGDEPLPARSLRVDDRIVDFLFGGDHLDGRLEGLVAELTEPVAWQELLVDPDPPDPKKPQRLDSLKALGRWWRQQRQTNNGGVAFLHGPYGSGRLAAARAICTDTETPLLVADAAAALHSLHGFTLIVDLAYREARLRRAAIYWSHGEQLLEAEVARSHWDYLLKTAEQYPGLTCLASQTVWDPAGRFRSRDFLRQEFPVPLYPARLRLWDHHLPAEAGLSLANQTRPRLIEALANSFQLTEGQILDAIAAAGYLAKQRAPDRPLLTSEDLYEGCRRQSGRRLVSFAHRVEPRPELTFHDLVLPRPSQRQLLELRQRIHYRSEVLSGTGFEQRLTLGKGLIALFTGSSGTGKTMAAQLLATKLGVDLYKVDMSAVVSKYVGETEKNLSRVFAEAEDSNAIIFFDEADALFGKRGKVEEARDRWANLEVNYLLQRVEEYSGVVILATNLRQNIDEAFIRRIHVIVDFPFPETEARTRIWLGLFPAGLVRPPKAQLQVLAERFRLAGGSIQNIVVDAAYRARARDSRTKAGGICITQHDLILATAREYQKLGKPITKGEFGEEFYEWVEDEILFGPGPDKGARYRLWREAFPPNVAPPPETDLYQIAERFPLREFAIRAVVQEAVKQATVESGADGAEQVSVTLRHLALTLARHYQRLGQSMTKLNSNKAGREVSHG